MKNNEKNSNKKIAGIYYFASLCFASLCFYIAAIINSINGDNNSMSVVFLCLGTSNLCLGSVYLNKDKDRDNVNKNNKK